MTTMTMNTELGVSVEIDDCITYHRRDDSCEKHGPFENTACAPNSYFATGNPPRWIGCPECLKEREAERKLREREVQERKWLADRIGRAGIPHRFRDATLKSYVADDSGQQRALEAAMSYAAEFPLMWERGESLLLLGNVGNGKTHLAVGITREAMEQGATAIFTSLADMIGRVKATWGASGDDSEAKVIRRFINVDLLVIDEVGSIKCSGREREILFAILGGRHNAVLPTIFTANLKSDELPGYLGEQVVSRLRESGSKSVIFNWQDYRPIKAKQTMATPRSNAGRGIGTSAAPAVENAPKWATVKEMTL